MRTGPGGCLDLKEESLYDFGTSGGHIQKRCCPNFAIFQGSPLFILLSRAHHPPSDVREPGLNWGEMLVSFAPPFDGRPGVRVKLPVVCFSHPPLRCADLSAGSLLPQFVDPTLPSGNPILNGCPPIGEKRKSHARPSTHQRQFSCYRFRC